MKIKLAEYVANLIVELGITDGFSVVGGGAIHLNDAFGHQPGLNMLYNHHEQAASIAAEAYARLNSKPALVCVTTGPGGINALNGVASAYLDSLPMLVISGQVRYDTTKAYELKTTGANVRSVGDQEFDIINTVKNMTKYSMLVEEPEKIKYYIEKAFYYANSGRKGPTWVDIPINFQGMYIDDDKLEGYFDSEEYIKYKKQLEFDISDEEIINIIDDIKNAKRPILYAGYGIRLANAHEVFRELVKKLNIPVVTYWNAIDLIETDNDLYCGRSGNMGDRAGNFAIQNSDLLLIIGSRVSIRQVGYSYKTWAKNAKVIMVDIDKEEMKKHTLHIDRNIQMDAKKFIEKINKILEKNNNVGMHKDWCGRCKDWKNKYKVVTEKNYGQKEKVNVYAFVDYLSNRLKENTLTCVSNGACCVVGSQAFVVKNNSRFHNNNAIASMGYGLPAAIGACISNNKKEVYCLEGDGSIMMNLQELQTIITNKLPIKIFLINNEGYHSIRITQNNLFDGSKVGIGEESKDLSFPNYELITKAFGYKYYEAKNNDEMKKVVDDIINVDGSCFVQIFTDTKQVWEPKSSVKKMPDGSLFSPPLEDMSPFLSDEEMKNNIINYGHL